jgi:hypothetical protein
MDYKNRIIVHYTHEKRFASIKRDIHKIHHDVFDNTPAMDVRMIVDNRNRRTATDDLIHKKPLKSILKNKPFKSKQHNHRLKNKLLPVKKTRIKPPSH